MIKFVKQICQDRRGNVLAIAAAAMPLVMGAAGLATDTIQWVLWKRQLQRAADSAAIAGVYERVQDGGQTEVEGAVAKDLTVNHHTGIGLLSGYPDVDLLGDSGDMQDRVQVSLAIQKKLSFSSIFLSSPPIIRVNSIAATVPPTDEYCVVSLENSASKTGITVGGNAKIEMNCGMISNSPASNSALANGSSSEVHASVMAAVGGVEKSSNWHVDKYDPYVAAIDDPYGHVNIDRSQMNCFNSGGKYPLLGTSTSNNFNGANATVTLTDALTGMPNANCFRGLSVGSGETLTLPAGTYYIGQDGINIQGTLNATAGVTLVLTNNVGSTGTSVGQIDVNATANVNITAPTTGPFSGIAIYQDRAASDSAQTNKINGNATNTIIGALYFPKQEIVYNGSGTTSYVCTRLVGRRVTFSGTASQTNKFEKGSACPVFGHGGIQGGRRVRLVG